MKRHITAVGFAPVCRLYQLKITKFENHAQKRVSLNNILYISTIMTWILIKFFVAFYFGNIIIKDSSQLRRSYRCLYQNLRDCIKKGKNLWTPKLMFNLVPFFVCFTVSVEFFKNTNELVFCLYSVLQSTHFYYQICIFLIPTS